MEDIIIAALFLYPGALVDAFSKRIFRRTYEESDESDYAKAAKYFAYSVIITICSLLIFALLTNKGVANFDDIKKSLAGIINLANYLGISLLTTAVFTLALAGLQRVIIFCKSGYSQVTQHTGMDNSTDCWKEIFYGSAYRKYRSALILRITSNGTTKAGFISYAPNDFGKGVILRHTRLVEEQLEQEKSMTDYDEMYIGQSIDVFYDTQSGSFVELFDGRELKAWMDSLPENQI